MPSYSVPVHCVVRMLVVVEGADHEDAAVKAALHMQHHYDTDREKSFIEGVYIPGTAKVIKDHIKNNGPNPFTQQ